MHPFRSALIFFIWVLAGTGTGWIASLSLPKSYVSAADLALEADALSSEGLAQFEEVKLENTIALQVAAALLTAPEVTNYAAQKSAGYSATDVKAQTKISYKEKSPIIQLRMRARAADDAQILSRALIEKAMALDRTRDEQRIRHTIQSVDGQLADTQKQLAEINRQIQRSNVERGSALSSDRERQQAAAMELAGYEQRLSALKVDEGSLANRRQRIDELIAAAGTGQSPPTTFELGDLEKSTAIADARRTLIEQQSALASLESRYGRKHARVQAANAEVLATREVLRGLLSNQRSQVDALLADNRDAQKLLHDKITVTESEARQADLTLDPVYAELVVRRDALRISYNLLASRLAELKVYVQAKTPRFYVLSEPSNPGRPSLLPLMTSVGLGAAIGAVIGLTFLSLRRTAHAPAGGPAANPSYVAD